MRKARLVAALSALVSVSCSGPDDFEPSREAVRQELRDPASAEFRNEVVRTLWTKGGQRLVLYCAEVNAENAFGGKTGFKPVDHIRDHKNLNANVRPVWKIGAVNLYENGTSANYYVNCMRPDTEREDEDFGKAIIWFGAFDEAAKSEIDKMVPILSDDPAP